MGWACGMYRREQNVLVGKLGGRRLLGRHKQI
jgi:hypothetical protein